MTNTYKMDTHTVKILLNLIILLADLNDNLSQNVFGCHLPRIFIELPLSTTSKNKIKIQLVRSIDNTELLKIGLEISMMNECNLDNFRRDYATNTTYTYTLHLKTLPFYLANIS